MSAPCLRPQGRLRKDLDVETREDQIGHLRDGSAPPYGRDGPPQGGRVAARRVVVDQSVGVESVGVEGAEDVVDGVALLDQGCGGDLDDQFGVVPQAAQDRGESVYGGGLAAFYVDLDESGGGELLLGEQGRQWCGVGLEGGLYGGRADGGGAAEVGGAFQVEGEPPGGGRRRRR